MKSFREQVTEARTKRSAGYDMTTDSINKLEMMLTPKSRVAKSIIKDLGSDYEQEFKELQNLMGDIAYKWEEIRQAIEAQDFDGL